MEKITVIQVKHHIVSQVKQAILSGRLAPDQELVQEELAERLGVSRTPVREMLQQLEEEGFVHRLPNRHVQVEHFDGEAIRDNLSMLCAIELELLRQRQAGGESWLELLSASAEVLGRQPTVQAELDLHGALSAGRKNRYLRQLHVRLLEGYYRFLLEELDCDRSESHRALQQFVRAVRTGDGAEGETALRGYFKQMADELGQLI